MDLNRRFFLRGALSVLAAPAIVKVASNMPIKAPPLVTGFGLARVKEMGEVIDYDADFVRVTERLVANHPNYIFWPGANMWFGKMYEDSPPQYDQLFQESA